MRNDGIVDFIDVDIDEIDAIFKLIILIAIFMVDHQDNTLVNKRSCFAVSSPFVYLCPGLIHGVS